MWASLACLAILFYAPVRANVVEPAIPWAEPNENLVPVWVIAIVCTFLGVVVSVKAIIGHLRWFTHPKIQHYIIRILLTMPVYGICALLTLLFPPMTVPLILFRNSYQAFMVYNFVELMIAYFTPHGTEETRIGNMIKVLERVPKTKAKPPCCCMGTIHPGGHFLKDKVLLPVKCFAVAVPAFAIIGLLTDQYKMYAFGVNDTSRAWFWLNLLTVLSTFWALSGLFTIFQVLEPFIKNIKLQNTCIHIVLGPMVFQELIIGILAESGTIGDMFGLPAPQSALTLLNLIFCIECMLVGFLFTVAFPSAAFYEMDPDTHKFHSAPDDTFVQLEMISGRARRRSVTEAQAHSKRGSLVDRVLHRPDLTDMKHDHTSATGVVVSVPEVAQNEGAAELLA